MNELFKCVNCKFRVPCDEIGIALMQAHINDFRQRGFCTYGLHDYRKVRDREYPPDIPTATIDHGVTAVFAEFPDDTWRQASLREIVGVVMKTHYANNVIVLQSDGDERNQ